MLSRLPAKTLDWGRGKPMVRVSTPRIAPLDPDALGPEAQKVMGNFKGETPLNIFRTLAQHPDLLRRWLVFANHVLESLPWRPGPGSW